MTRTVVTKNDFESSSPLWADVPFWFVWIQNTTLVVTFLEGNFYQCQHQILIFFHSWILTWILTYFLFHHHIITITGSYSTYLKCMSIFLVFLVLLIPSMPISIAIFLQNDIRLLWFLHDISRTPSSSMSFHVIISSTSHIDINANKFIYHIVNIPYPRCHFQCMYEMMDPFLPWVCCKYSARLIYVCSRAQQPCVLIVDGGDFFPKPDFHQPSALWPFCYKLLVCTPPSVRRNLQHMIQCRQALQLDDEFFKLT